MRTWTWEASYGTGAFLALGTFQPFIAWSAELSQAPCS